MSQQIHDETARQKAIDKLTLLSSSPSEPFETCPRCGWNALIFKTWRTGCGWARSYKCLECKWGQSGNC